jgi:hypothetical protein
MVVEITGVEGKGYPRRSICAVERDWRSRTPGEQEYEARCLAEFLTYFLPSGLLDKTLSIIGYDKKEKP